MAPGRQRPARDRADGGKHGWLAIDAYFNIHESALERHPFVLEDRTAFTRSTKERREFLSLTGQVICRGGIVIEVEKVLSVRLNARNETQVRGLSYRYLAHVQGRGNLLRYDNAHDLDEFDRHEYDFVSREQRPIEILSREELPTLIEMIAELEELADRLGLTDS